MINVKKEKKLVSTKPLSILITIVKIAKADYYLDLIQNYDVNMQITIIGNGTTSSTVFKEKTGNKAIIFSFILDENIPTIMNVLKEKFKTIKNGKGVAYSIPLTSVMGVSIYNFLSNNQSTFV